MVFARSDFVSVQHPVSAIEPSITTSKTNGIVIFISGNFGLTCGKRLHGENCAESFGILGSRIVGTVNARSPLSELARVVVRLDHVASIIINANHSIV
jgi:hypothetical protein